MTQRFPVTFSVGLIALGLGAGGPAAGQARFWDEPSTCDRACLTGLVATYLAALVAHDPSNAPLAADLKFVENTAQMRPGEGLWATASALPTTFKIHVPDPVARQVGFIGIMQESGSPIQLGLRLKIENGEIVEAEHLVVRNLSESSLANLQTPRPGLLATVPRAERLPREVMIVLAMTYYDSIEQSDGRLLALIASAAGAEVFGVRGRNATARRGGRRSMHLKLLKSRQHWTSMSIPRGDD